MPFWKKPSRANAVPASESGTSTASAMQSSDALPNARGSAFASVDAEPGPAELPVVALSATTTTGPTTVVEAPEAVGSAPSGRRWSVAQIGFADFSTISAAIAAASAGDTIVISVGCYQEDLKLEKSVHLVGEGDAKQRPEEGESINFALVTPTSAGSIVVATQGCTISNMVFHQDNETEPTSPPCIAVVDAEATFKRCTVVGPRRGVGLQAESSELVLQDNLFVDGQGVWVTKGSTAKLEDNVIDTSSGLSMAAVYVQDGSTASLIGNTLWGSLMADEGLERVEGNSFNDGMILGDGCRATFIRNSIIGLVQISNCTPTFAENIIGGDASATVWIQERANPVLRKNRLSGMQSILSDVSGVTISDGALATIEDNEFSGASGPALICSDDAHPTVRGNKFHDINGYAIWVKDAGGLFVDNEIYENQTNVAIRIEGSSEPRLARNKIRTNSRAGIAIDGGAKAILEHNEIIDNNGPGVAALNGSSVDMQSNRIARNQGYGVLFTHRSTGTLRNNDLRKNHGQNIGIDDSSMELFNLADVMRSNQVVD